MLAGDVGEFLADIEETLRALSARFARVIWVPGNHELWSHPRDPSPLRGEERYRHLVRVCRAAGIDTPEDPFPVWDGPGGPVTVAPLFVGYDYTFRPPGTATKDEALAAARAARVMGSDERHLHPDPYPSREAWCAARVEVTLGRLAGLDPALPSVLVNHFPLVREDTRLLRHPEFALWCGTEATADWHVRFGAAAVVYGHLHIPRTTWHDGVRFEEVSLGYPREWQARQARQRQRGEPVSQPGTLRQVWPPPAGSVP